MWSGSAVVLCRLLPMPGRLSCLDGGGAGAYCFCGAYGWGLFGHCFCRLSFLSSFSLSLGDWDTVSTGHETRKQPAKNN